MSYSRNLAHSPYMEWAKLRSSAQFSLVASGVAGCPLKELNVDIGELEISGPNVYGYERLLAAIAHRYQARQECVVTTTGTAMANYLAMAAAANPGDEVLIEQPTYEPLVSAAQYLGLRVKRFGRYFEDGFQIDRANLRRSITADTKLVVLTNLHNPSGVLTSEDTLREIAKIAQEVGARVLVDEAYLEMLFQRPPSTSFHVAPNQFLVTNSLTKAFGLSGLRCGWVLGEENLARRIWRLTDLHGVTAPFVAEQLSYAAFQNLEPIALRAKTMLNANRKLLHDFLASRTEFETVWPEYGAMIFPRLRTGHLR